MMMKVNSWLNNCRTKCEDSFEHRCDSLGCIQGCELGGSNEYRFVPKDLASTVNSDDEASSDDDDDTIEED